MDKEERIWLGVLIAVALLFNTASLSKLVPWQEWLLWSKPQPEQKFIIEMGNYAIKLPTEVINIKTNQYAEFEARTTDVTYGLGVFRQDGTLVFQMQVLPGRENSIIWKFDTPGKYDLRSTEYSGPLHSKMFIRNAINVIP